MERPNDGSDHVSRTELNERIREGIESGVRMKNMKKMNRAELIDELVKRDDEIDKYKVEVGLLEVNNVNLQNNYKQLRESNCELRSSELKMGNTLRVLVEKTHDAVLVEEEICAESTLNQLRGAIKMAAEMHGV